MLDRLDLQVEVRPLTGAELDDALPAESSTAVRARVLTARVLQQQRGSLNARLSPRALREAIERGGYSMRAITRSLPVARTIADLAGDRSVGVAHLAEALQDRAYEARRFLPQG